MWFYQRNQVVEMFDHAYQNYMVSFGPTLLPPFKNSKVWSLWHGVQGMFVFILGPCIPSRRADASDLQRESTWPWTQSRRCGWCAWKVGSILPLLSLGLHCFNGNSDADMVPQGLACLLASSSIWIESLYTWHAFFITHSWHSLTD